MSGALTSAIANIKLYDSHDVPQQMLDELEDAIDQPILFARAPQPQKIQQTPGPCRPF